MGVISYGIGQKKYGSSPMASTISCAGWIFHHMSRYREKFGCFERVKDNNASMEDKAIKWYQVREYLLDPKTWLLALFSLAQNIPTGDLVTFSASL
ncbi:hypothetical protein N7495_001108 [Penicillium taxi]|uniref:uncharacterized protein n=1 Tax=Penicillium taxi TaxID=168475 RepID=UPI002544FDF4|nr:uncharacterized protein N7495_001108 [Penicillium taxi]KAJ5908426.1 hypothetical protein N7495_001108 [Penicillium taxi]